MKTESSKQDCYYVLDTQGRDAAVAKLGVVGKFRVCRRVIVVSIVSIVINMTTAMRHGSAHTQSWMTVVRSPQPALLPDKLSRPASKNTATFLRRRRATAAAAIS